MQVIIRSYSKIINYSLILFFLLVSPFLYLSWCLGCMGLSEGLQEVSKLNALGWKATNDSLSAHMLVGAFLTLLAPTQLIMTYMKMPLGVHRLLGVFVVVLSGLTSLGGLFYIVLHGTRGGMPMNIGFSLYGVLVILSAFLTARYARNRIFSTHKEWAWRLTILALGSWFYRVCYGIIFFIDSSGPGHSSDFRGPFDLFMNFAFYLPPLLLFEWYLRKIKNNYSFHPASVSVTIFLLNVFFVIGCYGFYKKVI